MDTPSRLVARAPPHFPPFLKVPSHFHSSGHLARDADRPKIFLQGKGPLTIHLAHGCGRQADGDDTAGDRRWRSGARGRTDGSYHSIMVPGGLTAGQQFSVELLAVGSAAGAASAAETQRLRMELDAERALRRETQQEALRARTALEALQMKRAQDHAFFRESVKRQRRVIEQSDRD